MDIKLFVPTSFFVSSNVLNIRNKVLNENVVWEHFSVLCLFPKYINHTISKNGKENTLKQNRVRHVS